MNKESTKKPLVKWLFLLIGILVASYYISNNWYQLMMIQGESMSPSYHNLQLVILERHSEDYTYGDVVAFRCEALQAVLVKRIAACPGDKVVIKQGILYVNDSVSALYDESVFFEYAGILENMIQLEENQYIVIGDNVAESKDSRAAEVGWIDKDKILGKLLKSKRISK